jgi:hypothetical protein
MNLRTFKRLITTIALLGSLAAASGQSMSDTFDTYTLGTVGGQGGWEGWTGAPVAGTVSTLQAFSGTQSLQVVAGNDTVRPFSGVTSGQWTLSLQQYIPSASSGVSWLITMNSYPSSLNWSAQIQADLTQGLVGVFDGAGAQAGSTLSLLKDQWVNIRFEINLSANSVSSFYNNTLLGTHAWQSGGFNQLQALDIYPDEGAGSAQIGSVFYDNVQLTQVPEPGTASLLALGGLAVLYRFRKRV